MPSSIDKEHPHNISNSQDVQEDIINPTSSQLEESVNNVVNKSTVQLGKELSETTGSSQIVHKAVNRVKPLLETKTTTFTSPIQKSSDSRIVQSRIQGEVKSDTNVVDFRSVLKHNNENPNKHKHKDIKPTPGSHTDYKRANTDNISQSRLSPTPTSGTSKSTGSIVVSPLFKKESHSPLFKKEKNTPFVKKENNSTLLKKEKPPQHTQVDFRSVLHKTKTPSKDINSNVKSEPSLLHQPIKLQPVAKSSSPQPIKLQPVARSSSPQPIKLHSVTRTSTHVPSVISNIKSNKSHQSEVTLQNLTLKKTPQTMEKPSNSHTKETTPSKSLSHTRETTPSKPVSQTRDLTPKLKKQTSVVSPKVEKMLDDLDKSTNELLAMTGGCVDLEENTSQGQDYMSHSAVPVVIKKDSKNRIRVKKSEESSDLDNAKNSVTATPLTKKSDITDLSTSVSSIDKNTSHVHAEKDTNSSQKFTKDTPNKTTNNVVKAVRVTLKNPESSKSAVTTKDCESKMADIISDKSKSSNITSLETNSLDEKSETKSEGKSNEFKPLATYTNSEREKGDDPRQTKSFETESLQSKLKHLNDMYKDQSLFEPLSPTHTDTKTDKQTDVLRDHGTSKTLDAYTIDPSSKHNETADSSVSLDESNTEELSEHESHKSSEHILSSQNDSDFESSSQISEDEKLNNVNHHSKTHSESVRTDIEPIKREIKSNQIFTRKNSDRILYQQLPVFHSNMEDKVANEGSCVTFEVKVTGSPKPEISWFMNNNKIKVCSIYTILMNHIAVNHKCLEYSMKTINIH